MARIVGLEEDILEPHAGWRDGIPFRWPRGWRFSGRDDVVAMTHSSKARGRGR